MMNVGGTEALGERDTGDRAALQLRQTGIQALRRLDHGAPGLHRDEKGDLPESLGLRCPAAQ